MGFTLLPCLWWGDKGPRCACPHGSGRTKELCHVTYEVYSCDSPHAGCGRHVCSIPSHSSLYEQPGDLHSCILGAVMQKKKSLPFPQQLVRWILAGGRQQDALSP